MIGERLGLTLIAPVYVPIAQKIRNACWHLHPEIAIVASCLNNKHIYRGSGAFVTSAGVTASAIQRFRGSNGLRKRLAGARTTAAGESNLGRSLEGAKSGRGRARSRSQPSRALRKGIIGLQSSGRIESRRLAGAAGTALRRALTSARGVKGLIGRGRAERYPADLTRS